MSKRVEYYIVSAEALPDVFLKVAEAKRMLQTGEAGTVGEAARLVGISRSAFYKYKDCVFAYNERYEGHIVTLHAILEDRSGVMLQFVNALYKCGANILTVYQDIPNGGRASVSVSFRTGSEEMNISDVLDTLHSVEGVVSVSQILG